MASRKTSIQTRTVAEMSAWIMEAKSVRMSYVRYCSSMDEIRRRRNEGVSIANMSHEDAMNAISRAQVMAGVGFLNAPYNRVSSEQAGAK